MQRRHVLAMLAAASLTGAKTPSARAQAIDPACSRDAYIAWVAEALKRIQTIHQGMTRQQLLGVFTTEGGLSTGLQRRFVSRDCPFFKVDVEFKPVDRPSRDVDGRVTVVEDNNDIISRISPPYLQFSIMD